MCLVREMENGKENNFSLGPLFGEEGVFFPNWGKNGLKIGNYLFTTRPAYTLVFFSFLLNFFFKV